MKLGVRNCVRDPTSASKYGSDRAAWGVSAQSRMREISLFVTFLFSFLFLQLHLPHRSPQWADFHDLYVKRRIFAQGSAFWGSRSWIFTFPLPPFSPKKFENLHYGLWQIRTTITRPFLKIEERCLHQSGVFGVRQFNAVVEVCLRPTLVTMVTNWWFSDIKLAKTQLRILHQTGVFKVVQFNGIVEIYNIQPLLPW